MVELANCQATAAKDATTQALNVPWIHGRLRLFFLWGGVGCVMQQLQPRCGFKHLLFSETAPPPLVASIAMPACHWQTPLFSGTVSCSPCCHHCTIIPSKNRANLYPMSLV